MNIAYRSESESNLMQRSAVTKRHLKVRICFKYPIFFRVPRADVIMFVKEEEKPSKCDDIRSSLLILIKSIRVRYAGNIFPMLNLIYICKIRSQANSVIFYEYCHKNRKWKSGKP